VNLRPRKTSTSWQAAWRLLFSGFLPLVMAATVCPRVHADVGVVLSESLNTGIATITGSGHSEVYFSRICPESPVKLRLCRPDEEGSVISVYANLGEDQRYGWNIVPLGAYLYGAGNLQDRPLFGSPKIKGVIEDGYRQTFLAGYCSRSFCAENRNAEWRYAVGAAFDRSIYLFVVSTTLQQDMEIIAKFNALPNRDQFNGFTRNCADFTRGIINTYFPGATHPDYVNDFGMTSPKAIARSFTHYALRHPDMDFRVVRFSQVPGSIKRSSDCRNGTEQIFRAKKWMIPMMIFASHELPIFIVSYGLTGRFSPQYELERRPTLRATQLGFETKAAKSGGNYAQADELKAAQAQERAEILGAKNEWTAYGQQFNSVVDRAIHEEVIPSRRSLREFARHVDNEGTPFLDSHGALWMQVSDGAASRRVGLTATNVLAPESDPRIAYNLLLAHIDFVLRSGKRDRETMVDFRQEWGLLMEAQASVATLAASSDQMGGQ
jgi:hypothetical protein